jgi:glycosyltransferase involved in cell wall biosynthesis
MEVVSACTIVANNYLPRAHVLVESYKEHHPGAEVYVYLADRPDPGVDYASFPFVTVFAEDIGIPAFFNMAFRYTLVEFNTALKPFILAHLRDRFGLDRAFYLDPDILVLHRLTALEDALSRATAVLTPHITQPLDESYHPSERLILMCGVYNLGFLGLRLDESTGDFLRWWQDRLRRFCFIDVHNGLFVDQSWMGLAPALLPSVEIVRDPAYNIAHWNLPHRRLRQVGNRWEVEGRPVGFFHFSGLHLDKIESVSRSQQQASLSTHPEIRPLFEEYRRRVLAAGDERFRRMPYGFDHFSDGQIRIPTVVRRALHRVDPNGMRWTDPFDLTCEDSFCSWLAEPLEFDRGFLSRAVLFLWEHRPDLVRRFPQVCGRDLPAYVNWLKRFVDRTEIDPVFLQGVRPKKTWSGREQPAKVIPYEVPLASVPVAPSLLGKIDVSQPGRFTRWLNEPVPGAKRRRPVITRVALELHHSREDLQRAYPEPLDRDQLAYADWFCRYAGAEYELPRSLVRRVRRSLPFRARIGLAWGNAGKRLRELLSASRHGSDGAINPGSDASCSQDVRQPNASDVVAGESVAATQRPRISRAAPPGINVAGYFDYQAGVGQIARGTRRALAEARIPTAEIPVDQDPWARVAHGRIYQPAGMPYPITLIHETPQGMPRAWQLLPLAAAEGSVKIGYWFWELAHFPLSLADRFAYLDEVWAPSRFCQRSFDALTTIPVRYVPPCVLAPSMAPAERARYGLDDGRFYFFFSLDTRSIPERKNPFAAIDAFVLMSRRAQRDVGLLLNINAAQHDPDLLAALRKRASGAPIVLRTAPLQREEVEALLATCDAYLSLHCSEGLGLMLIEALYLQKPVIATAYGGVTDFFDESTGYPVGYALTRLNRDLGPYPCGAVWADPNVEHAAEMMLRVVENPQEAAARATAGRQRVEELYGIEAAAARFAAEIDRLMGQPRTTKVEKNSVAALVDAAAGSA